MTSQAAKMGIPSFQLEIPAFVRPHLVQNKEICKGWARAIVDVYTKVIIPEWENKTKKTQFN